MSDEAHKKMSVYDRDNKISDIASMAAEAFAEKYDPARNERDIKSRPEHYLAYTIPYLTVRALHRQETALASLKADSKWIKAFAIITGILTLVLVGLTIVLMIYASRLDTVIHSLRSIASPTSTVTPTPTLTPH
jgi:hypothetical protein